MDQDAIAIRNLTKRYPAASGAPEKHALKDVTLRVPKGLFCAHIANAHTRAALDVQAGLYGVPKADRWTDDILRLVGLEDKADAYARTLSGGMRRRLLLGKALVHRPHVLVLDEPTAGVDIELRQMLWENVRRLNAEGMTIILTTHYLEEAEVM